MRIVGVNITSYHVYCWRYGRAIGSGVCRIDTAVMSVSERDRETPRPVITNRAARYRFPLRRSPRKPRGRYSRALIRGSLISLYGL